MAPQDLDAALQIVRYKLITQIAKSRKECTNSCCNIINSILESSETSRQESLGQGPTSHNSAVEALPQVGSNTVSSANVDKNLLLRVVNNNVYIFSCKGNLTLLILKMTERKKQSSNAQCEINECTTSLGWHYCQCHHKATKDNNNVLFGDLLALWTVPRTQRFMPSRPIQFYPKFHRCHQGGGDEENRLGRWVDADRRVAVTKDPPDDRRSEATIDSLLPQKIQSATVSGI
ncbi:glutamate--tRNA ligase [Striga asiatica]|uniref:Glutamate--tRNA ligase n=1 Tax=Striga asiatica TaxID=4170 RepID=A0A5A7PU31_STRAF|nr:glutamate--tRNA ligase [Striga asiatica]